MMPTESDWGVLNAICAMAVGPGHWTYLTPGPRPILVAPRPAAGR